MDYSFIYLIDKIIVFIFRAFVRKTINKVKTNSNRISQIILTKKLNTFINYNKKECR